MLKKTFAALTAGDRVVVTGTQSEAKFEFEVGTVVRPSPSDGPHIRRIRFDTWSDGHGVGDHEWCFYDYNARALAITPFVETKKVVEEPKKKKAPKGPQQYKGNGKHAWERVTADTMRLRVPGGWLYGEYSHRLSRVTNSTFVPVPQAVGYAV
jgi:hypothetical protein